MENDKQLTLELASLRKLVAGDAVAIRGRATLEPAGGPGDKVFPPTHLVEGRNPPPGARYAFEVRRISGREATCVLLDSVQSQANRLEEALQALWADRRIALPVIEADFTAAAPDVGRLTSLSVPHRIADALLRDSFDEKGDKPFRLTDLGRSFTDASPRNAASLFKACPSALVFGFWDSTGPKGGLGAKFPRALVSEIVGIDAVPGVKTSSRIDPAGIEKVAGPLFSKRVTSGDAPEWTLEESEAERDPKTKEPVLWRGKGRPSEANHGNQPPAIDREAGGVTVDHAEQTVVLSIAGLRKLDFGDRASTEAARTVLTALGLLAVLAAEDRGHDLRSRCLLVPRRGEALRLEIVYRDGTTAPLGATLDAALTSFKEAVEALPPGVAWMDGGGKPLQPGAPLARLRPSPKLVSLIQKSRELGAVGSDVDDAGE